MKPEDIEITEEIASRIEIFVRLTEVEHEAYKGRQPMTQDLFNSISKKIAPINTDLWIEFISNYAAFLPDDSEEEMEDDMEWNPPEDAESKEQMLAEIKAGIAKRKERQDKKKAELERQKEIFRKTYKIDI